MEHWNGLLEWNTGKVIYYPGYNLVLPITLCAKLSDTKYPLTQHYVCKDAVIGRLKRFDHFRRGSLSGSLLIDSLIQHHYITMMYRHCNSEHNNGILLNPPIQFRYQSTYFTRTHSSIFCCYPSFQIITFVPREYFNGMLYPINC